MAFSLPSSSTAGTHNALAADARSLDALKYAASQGSDPKAVREAAKQFESLFMRELIKSMREATMKSGLLDSSSGDLASDLLDQQLSVQMSGTNGGLTDAIMRQLSQQMGGAKAEISAGSTLSLPQVRRAGAQANASAAALDPKTIGPRGRDDFVDYHGSAADRVAQESGIPASFMLGQAGHETGWGKSEIRSKDGGNSFNLFGIKAGPGWTGKVAEITTTEYVNGTPRKVTARFRAYDSYEESFRDYARLIKESPRYEQAESVAKTGSGAAYASALQKAGYATDPAYAAKLSRAIQSVARAQQRDQA
ncbi:MAG: flagellar assembly peptidoglycan hydrolase FlgJ [Acidovorax sp.]|uniref:flagellar assembly peptidoglycan hydrolase FlgJ n=1 Tax=Acidovorax sp. TaxID=1872122 RepID=UPI0039E258ED